MTTQRGINLVVFLVLAILAAVGVYYFKPVLFNHGAGQLTRDHDHDHAAEAFNRGPHRGRLLESEDLQVEVVIFEPEGVPPRFRIYFYADEAPLSPSEAPFEMELKRINRVEKIPFKNAGDYLESQVEASEPHSFKVKLNAGYKGKPHEWVYESYEGRVELSKEAIKANKITVEEVGPISLEIKLDVMGKITPNDELTVYISPRFPGMVKAVNKKLGDTVRTGDVLSVIESNESLQNYEVKSETDGLIIKKNINLGMYLSGQENVYVISDLRTVWADFNVYRSDLPRIQVGDPIEVASLDGSLKQKAVISYISPIGNESTQSVLARAELTNQKGVWKPGLFVSGEITIENEPVSVAIKESALQTFRGWDVVFISAGNLFEIVPVKIGKKNKEWVEIKSGLKPGDKYVSENSYILKADLEKSGAKYDH